MMCVCICVNICAIHRFCIESENPFPRFQNKIVNKLIVATDNRHTSKCKPDRTSDEIDLFIQCDDGNYHQIGRYIISKISLFTTKLCNTKSNHMGSL